MSSQLTSPLFSLNSALDRLRERVPLQPHLGQMSILDQGHHQKLSKIETLRLAQNYIQVLTLFLATQRRLSLENLHLMLSRRLSQATGNLLRARLLRDLDFSIARRIIGEVQDVSTGTEDFDNDDGYRWFQPHFNHEEECPYGDYLDVGPFYGGCYN